MESTRCRWVTAVGIGRTQCWLQAVSGWYLSLYLLPIPQTPQLTCCKLRFIQLVTLSLFLSLSTVHCYTLPTFAVTNTPSTVSAFVHIGPHHPSVQTSFMDDPPPSCAMSPPVACSCGGRCSLSLQLTWFTYVQQSLATVHHVSCTFRAGPMTSSQLSPLQVICALKPTTAKKLSVASTRTHTHMAQCSSSCISEETAL